MLAGCGGSTWQRVRYMWVTRNGKYYIYFGANGLQEGDNTVLGGIGVAMAGHPAGPFVDPIGAPLIGAYHNGAQPIDQDVFIDDVDERPTSTTGATPMPMWPS